MTIKSSYRTGPSLKVTLGIPLAIAATGALGAWLTEVSPSLYSLQAPIIFLTVLTLIGSIVLIRLLAPSSVEYIREVHKSHE